MCKMLEVFILERVGNSNKFVITDLIILVSEKGCQRETTLQEIKTKFKRMSRTFSRQTDDC